jgi:hypothetical protein
LWLGLWCIFLIAIFLGVGLYFIQSMRANQRAAADRHAARMDPNADEPGVTAADRALPPGANPTLVSAGVYVDRILELSVKDVHWAVEFYLWFRWRGDALKSCAGFQIVDGKIESQQLEADELIAGEHYQRFRVVATISKFFDVSRFPRDEHLLTIGVEHPAYQRDALRLVADHENSAVSSRVNIPAFRLGPPAVIEKPHKYKTNQGDPRLAPGAGSTHSQLRMGILIERSGWGLFFKMFQALYVAVVLSLLAFFVRPTDVDPRFGLGVGALFAVVANAYVVSSLVPDTGSFALADIVNGMGIGLILLTVVQSTLALHLCSVRGEVALTRAMDRLSFFILLPCYVLVNVALPLAAGY